VSQQPEQLPPPQYDDERDRRTANIVLLVGAVLFIGAGWWLVDAMLAARKADECIAAGRRNCTPVEVTAPR